MSPFADQTNCEENIEDQEEENNQQIQLNSFKPKEKIEFKEKFEGKYYFNSQKVKSKSELLICYFLTANGINFSYEHCLDIE